MKKENKQRSVWEKRLVWTIITTIIGFIGYQSVAMVSGIEVLKSKMENHAILDEKQTQMLDKHSYDLRGLDGRLISVETRLNTKRRRAIK